jgi:hypothetical protein
MVSIADEVQRRFGQIRRQPMIAWLATPEDTMRGGPSPKVRSLWFTSENADI